MLEEKVSAIIIVIEKLLLVNMIFHGYLIYNLYTCVYMCRYNTHVYIYVQVLYNTHVYICAGIIHMCIYVQVYYTCVYMCRYCMIHMCIYVQV